MFLKIIDTGNISKTKLKRNEGYYYLRYGTHRMAAILILLSQKRIEEELVVGVIGVGKKQESLTAGRLKNIFNKEPLYSFNTYFRQNKVNEYVKEFDIKKLFDIKGRKGDEARDEGIGIWITLEKEPGKREFKELRDTYKDVADIPLDKFINNQ